MKKYIVLVGIFLPGLLITWFFVKPERAGMVWKEKTGGDLIRESSVMYTKTYIDDVSENLPQADADHSGVEKNITAWEQRILDFGRDHHISLKDSMEIRGLADKTVSLLDFLKEANSRQRQGLEPYTAVSGFNTMTLIMAIESEFKEKLGFSFSDFFASQDPEILTRALN